tara:strand:+ start:1324 stop:1557 length:234 start_codon:yes stop_codon:yes gene_type:complete
MNILKDLFIALIKIYRFVLSPFFPNSCKFHPTCSSYALICFQKFSFFKALRKSVIRLLKCNPWFNTGGIDDPIEGEK